MSARRVARGKEGKLLHAFRQPSSPQSVLMWSSSSLCVSKKRRTEDDERFSQRKEGGGSFRVLMAFYTLSTVPNQSSPRGPRCSVSLANHQVIRVQYHPTTKKEKKCCSWKLLALFDPGLFQGWFPVRPLC